MFGARMPATAREAAAPKARRQPKQKARKGSPTHVLVVDGHRVTSTGLQDGSEVKVGRTTMTVRVEEDEDV
jgi:hypothetical protein